MDDKIREELLKYIGELKSLYSERSMLVMPTLRFAQEKFGRVDDNLIEEISRFLDIPAIKILSTARFYHFFTEEDSAKYRIEICTSISCSLLGSEHLYDYINRKFVDEEIKNNFSVTRVGCLGSCGTAPAMLVNGVLFENLNFERVDRVIEGLKSGKDIDKILG
ncbi:MAG: NAD(P)H-dependent oxidoreductase subunit E [Deltaproteobacteria bacterium]|nr:NAD(P)H-dependent oxidoreductase subunit E [Deltaproteobacteria bacterium]